MTYDDQHIGLATFLTLDLVAQLLAHVDFQFDENEFIKEAKKSHEAVEAAIRKHTDAIMPRLQALAGYPPETNHSNHFPLLFADIQ
jgi:hypothetical protein